MSKKLSFKIEKLSSLSLFNTALAEVSVILIVGGVIRHNPIAVKNLSYDYFVWASTLLTVIAVYRELKRLQGKLLHLPLYSTLLLLIVGVVFTVIGRVLSIYYNGVFTLGYFRGLIGSYYTVEGYISSLLVLTGSLLVGLTMCIHMIINGIIVIREKPLLSDVYVKLVLKASKLEKYPVIIALIVGVFAFTFRFIPELYWWQWLIGWDTPEYVAHLLDFRERLNPFARYYWMGNLRNTPPLLPILLLPFTFIADGWSIFKVYPSIAYSLLAALSALITIIIYRKSWYVGLFSGFFTAMYILNLRISWDYHKQLLGTVIVLIAILLLEKWGEPRGFKQAIIAILLPIACGLSSEITGLVGLTMFLVLFYMGLKHRNLFSIIPGLIGLILTTMLGFYYLHRAHTTVDVTSVLTSIFTIATRTEGADVISYLVAGYGITLPPALITLAKYKKPYITATVTVLMLAGLSPIITPYTCLATWYRFLIEVAPLMSTLAVIGLFDTLKNKWIILLYLLIASLPGLAFTYGYNWSQRYYSALREFPDTLVPASPNVRLLETYYFFKNNSDLIKNAIIVADPDFAKYVHMAIRNPDPSRLVWRKAIAGDDICRLMNSTGADKAILVAVQYVSGKKCSLRVEPVSEELKWINIALLEKR
jgi:hypothetical protein